MNQWIACHIETLRRPDGQLVVVHGAEYVQPMSSAPYVQSVLVESGMPGKTHTLSIEPASLYFNTDEPKR